jgi:hypothetical protein
VRGDLADEEGDEHHAQGEADEHDGCEEGRDTCECFERREERAARRGGRGVSGERMSGCANGG